MGTLGERRGRALEWLQIGMCSLSTAQLQGAPLTLTTGHVVPLVQHMEGKESFSPPTTPNLRLQASPQEVLGLPSAPFTKPYFKGRA